MQNLTHDMENVFSEVRTGNIKVTAPMIDTLFQCLDALEEYLANIQENADEGENDNEPLIKELNRILNSKGQGIGDAQEPAEEKEKEESSASWETIELKPEDKHDFKYYGSYDGINYNQLKSNIGKLLRTYLEAGRVFLDGASFKLSY